MAIPDDFFGSIVLQFPVVMVEVFDEAYDYISSARLNVRRKTFLPVLLTLLFDFEICAAFLSLDASCCRYLRISNNVLGFHHLGKMLNKRVRIFVNPKAY